MRVCILDKPGLEGAAISKLNDGTKPGRLETAANGFLWIEIKGDDCLDLFKNILVDNPEWGQPDQPERINTGVRERTISLDSPVPQHPATAKCGRSHMLRAGRTIRKHLNKNIAVPCRRKDLVIK